MCDETGERSAVDREHDAGGAGRRAQEEDRCLSSALLFWRGAEVGIECNWEGEERLEGGRTDSGTAVSVVDYSKRIPCGFGDSGFVSFRVRLSPLPKTPKRQNATQPNSVQHCVQRCAATGGVGGRPRSASRISYDTRTARRVAVFPPAASRCPLASLSPQPSPPETSAYHRATRVPPPLSNVRATAPNAPLSHPLLCLAFARRAALPPFPRRGIATTSTPPTPPPRPQLTAFSRLARRRQASLPAHR